MLIRKKNLITLNIFLFLSYFSFSQNTNKIDSLKVIIKNASDSAKCDLYYKTAVEFYRSDYDSVLFYCKKAISAGTGVVKDSELAYSYLLGGVAYRNIGELDSAVLLYNAAKLIFIKDTFLIGEGKVNNNLGKVYHQMGKFDEAIEVYLEAEQIFINEKDTLSLANVYSNMAELNIDLKQFDKANEHFLKARKLFKNTQNTIDEAVLLYDVGSLKIRENELDSALFYYYSAIKIWKPAKHEKKIGNCYLKIGDIYKQKNNLNKSISNYLLAEQYYKTANYPFGTAEVSIQLGNLYFSLKKYNKSIHYYSVAFELSEYIEAKGLLLEVYKHMYLIYKESGNYSKSLSFHEKYLTLKDSILGEQQEKNIAEIQTKYETFENKRQIERLRDSTKIQQLKNEKTSLEAQKQKSGNVILIIIVIVVILFGILMIYRYNLKTKLSNRLTKSLEEREVLLKELHHRVKNNLQIISSLLNLQIKHSGTQNIDEILQISKDRIATMVVIHEKLYRSKNLKLINIADYIPDLAENLYNSFNLKEKNIIIDTNIQELMLDVNKLVPCGLIINELVTNSIKHAFPAKKSGEIKISTQNENGICKIRIKDSGKGLPEDFNFKDADTLGIELITGLAKQMNGKLENIKSISGAEFLLSFSY